jgi:DNA-binding MarR family transcriptional regulator
VPGVTPPVRPVAPALARRFQQICLVVTGEALAGEELMPLHYAGMIYLYFEPDLDQNGLAARIGIDRNYTSRIVEQLESMGVIDRRVDDDDRRARRLRLSAKGRALFERLRPKMMAANDRILAPLDPRDRKLLIELLGRLIEGNRAYARPGGGRRKRSSRTIEAKRGG